MNRLRFFGVAILCLLLASRSLAAEYRFTNIADTSTTAPVGMFNGFQLACDDGICRFLEPPAISGNTVAFYGQFGPLAGIFKGNGGPVTTIVKTGDPVPFGSTFERVRELSISGQTVAFDGVDSGPTDGIFIGNGGSLSKIVADGDMAPNGTFSGFDNPSINGNTIVFRTHINPSSAIFTVHEGSFTKILDRAILLRTALLRR